MLRVRIGSAITAHWPWVGSRFWSTDVASIYDNHFSTSLAPVDEAPAPADAAFVLPPEANQVLRSIERAYSTSFAVIDCGTGQVLRPAVGGLPVDLYSRLPSCEQVTHRSLPEIIDEVSPLLLLAVPLPSSTSATLVAVAAIVTERVESEQQIATAAA